MFLQIGKRTELADNLAKELGKERINFSSDLESQFDKTDLTEDSVVVTDLSQDLDIDEKELIKTAIARDATLVFTNSNSAKMENYAIVGVDASTVVIKNVNGGYRQQIIVDTLNESDVEEYEASQEAEAEYRDALMAMAIARGKSLDEILPPPKVEPDAYESFSQIDEVSDPLKRLSSWIKDDSFRKIYGNSDEGEFESYRVDRTNKSLIVATLLFNETIWYPGGTCSKSDSLYGGF